jgi:hypothetical protein
VAAHCAAISFLAVARPDSRVSCGAIPHNRREGSGSSALIYAYFILVFVTGGSSQQHGWTDVAAQLLGLPVLAFGLWRLGGQPGSRVRTWGLLAMGAVALLPWLQLLP